MSLQAQTYLFDEINRSINYCIDEYEISHAEAIGCLTLIAQGLAAQLLKINEEKEKKE